MLDLWLEGEFELIVCPQLIDEVIKALLRIGGKYHITPEEVEGFAARLAEEGLLFDNPENPARVVPDDPKDDYLIALALQTKADLLVSRDRHFEKADAGNLPIVTPGIMVRRLRDV